MLTPTQIAKAAKEIIAHDERSISIADTEREIREKRNKIEQLNRQRAAVFDRLVAVLSSPTADPEYADSQTIESELIKSNYKVTDRTRKTIYAALKAAIAIKRNAKRAAGAQANPRVNVFTAKKATAQTSAQSEKPKYTQADKQAAAKVEAKLQDEGDASAKREARDQVMVKFREIQKIVDSNWDQISWAEVNEMWNDFYITVKVILQKGGQKR